MGAIVRFALLSVAACLPAGWMTSCFDIEHSTRVYPDGSGKFAISITVLKENYHDKKWDSAEETLAGCLNCCEGYAAWTVPALKESEKSLTYELAAYFEDISKFRWKEAKGERETIWSFELAKTGEGQTLVFRDKILKDWIEAAGKALGPEEKVCETDDRYVFSVTVPGKITHVDGMPTPKGRTAEVRVDDKLKFAARKSEAAARKVVAGLSSEMKITWSGSEIPKEELEAFKKEFAAARETWKAMEPRIRKIAEEKKAKD
jgi:hypothetical protein